MFYQYYTRSKGSLVFGMITFPRPAGDCCLLTANDNTEAVGEVRFPTAKTSYFQLGIGEKSLSLAGTVDNRAAPEDILVQIARDVLGIGELEKAPSETPTH